MAASYKYAHAAFQNFPSEDVSERAILSEHHCFFEGSAKYINIQAINQVERNGYVIASKRNKKMDGIYELPTPKGKFSYYLTLPDISVLICIPETTRIERVRVIGDRAP